MSAQAIELANKVVEKLNGHTFTQAFTAARKYVPTHDVADLSGLTVEVSTTAKQSDPQTRSQLWEVYRVTIAVQKQVAGIEPADVDPLMDLMEEIADFMAFGALSQTNAQWAGTVNDPIYDPEGLLEENTFFSVLHCTYKLGRKPA